MIIFINEDYRKGSTINYIISDKTFASYYNYQELKLDGKIIKRKVLKKNTNVR